MTADCDSYREQLAATYPKLGHAIWEPTSVDVGDVGCIRDGKFLRLFNALHPEGHPSNLRFGVPEFHDPLVPRVANHIDKGILKHNHYCSSRIVVTSEPEFLAQGPDEPEKVTFSNGSRRGGAVLYLPVDASRRDTFARRHFGRWMIKHIDCWLAFARQLEFGIEQMEDIVLVTGCHRTMSWANAVFLEGHTDAQASFGVEVVRDPVITVRWQFFPSRTRGAMCSWGPEGKNLPENQCIFIRGFRVVRRLGILPRQLRGAAGPNPSLDRDHDDDEQHVELVSLPSAAMSRDPLHVLSEYIINQSPHCDMTLVHDDDLARIGETWDHVGLGAFHPDAMMDYLQVSKPEIVQLVVDGQPSTSANCAELGTKSYTVAMFSKEFQEWNRLPTHSTWRTDVLSAMLPAIVMSLVWASWFQFFIIVLSLLKLNSISSQVLYDPYVVVTAMCCATRFIIAAQPTTITFAAIMSALLLHVPEVNKIMPGVIIVCTFFRAIVLQILEPTYRHSAGTSPNSSAMNTPVSSRPPSPLTPFYTSGLLPVSDTDSDEPEPASPWPLDNFPPPTFSREGRSRWWHISQRARHRPRRPIVWGYRSMMRILRRVFRPLLFPRHPSTALLSLLFFTVLALSIAFLSIHLLNSCKEPQPWRVYCTIGPVDSPPPLDAHLILHNISTVASALPMPPFPPSNFEALPPAGVFVGVFSVDSSWERRMLIRSTWASHPRSRNGAGHGDGGAGTSRTIVRFIMSQPRKSWEQRVRVEMEEYKDIIILPTSSNAGKTHPFFTWAASMAWVPPVYFDTDVPLPNFSYSNFSSPMRYIASHDPTHAWQDRVSGPSSARKWVRPDFVVKVDDDSFVMLAELEARLRVTLHENRTEQLRDKYWDKNRVALSSPPGPDWVTPSSSEVQRFPSGASLAEDPLIYWGYLVKQRFMAGESYALSWSLVDWVSRDPTIKGLTRGAEDKQTAKWMRLHPRAPEVRWVAERCWIYDHPRSGTVYSHGFLFPSEATRVREGVNAFFDKPPEPSNYNLPTTSAQNRHDKDWGAPAEWALSTVSKFGTRYSLPLPNLTVPQSIEALVEGSNMSKLYEGGMRSAEDAWQLREGRKKRYNDQRVGGTIVVHFVKRHMWFFETVLALLEGDEETEYEIQRRVRDGQSPAEITVLSQTAGKPNRSQLDGKPPVAHGSARSAVQVGSVP